MIPLPSFRLLWLLLSILLCVACEKPVLDVAKTSPDTDSPVNLELSVKGFNVIPFEGTRTEQMVSDYCKHLNFVVYQSGKKVKAVSQTSDESHFGQASFSLEPGTYQVLALAHSASKNPTLTNPEKIQFTNADGYSDTFFCYETVVVDEEKTTEELVLNRVTSMFRFITKDSVPANVERIRFYYTGGSGALNAVTGYGCVNSQQTVFFDITDEMRGHPLTLEAYTIPKADKGVLKVTVTAYGQDVTIIKEKELEDVPIEVNKITEYTGYLFSEQNGNDDNPHHADEDGPVSFSIRLLTEWDGVLKGTF